MATESEQNVIKLTNNANYQQQLWEKIVRFWSDEKNEK